MGPSRPCELMRVCACSRPGSWHEPGPPALHDGRGKVQVVGHDQRSQRAHSGDDGVGRQRGPEEACERGAGRCGARHGQWTHCYHCYHGSPSSVPGFRPPLRSDQGRNCCFTPDRQGSLRVPPVLSRHATDREGVLVLSPDPSAAASAPTLMQHTSNKPACMPHRDETHQAPPPLQAHRLGRS